MTVYIILGFIFICMCSSSFLCYKMYVTMRDDIRDCNCNESMPRMPTMPRKSASKKVVPKVNDDSYAEFKERENIDNRGWR